MFRAMPVFCMLAFLIPPQTVGASDTPQEARHELMEDVGEAAKPVGKMLKGERTFDAAIVMKSFRTWSNAAGIFGDLFPEGSESGYETEAKDSI